MTTPAPDPLLRKPKAAPPDPRVTDLSARIAALEADVAGAEAKRSRIDHSITTRRSTIARLKAQLADIEHGKAHASNDT